MSLDFLTALAQIGKDRFNATLVDDTHTLGGDAQFHEAFLALDPKAMELKVGLKTTARSVLGVRNVVSRHRPLAGDLTYFRHDGASEFGVSRPLRKA